MGEQVAVGVVASQVAAAAERWLSANATWVAATRRRQRAVVRAQRRVVAATGGLGVAGWEAACRRRRIRSAAEARAVAVAVRARPAVEAALTEQARVVAEHDAALHRAEASMAAASQMVLDLGSLAVGLCGVDGAELRRWARHPAEVGGSGPDGKVRKPVDQGPAGGRGP